MLVALLLLGGDALAQAPRTREFTTAHDFIGGADLTGGVVVVSPGTDTARSTRERLSTGISSLRLPLTTSATEAPNLVLPDVTVELTDPNFTTAAITDGRTSHGQDTPGFVWRSTTGRQQHVDLAFHDGPRLVTGVTIHWGSAGGPPRYKIQVSDEDGWLTDATAWQDASGQAQSVVTLPAPVSTWRVRVVKDHVAPNPDAACTLDSMTVAEIAVATADTPVIHPVSVDSSYLDYAPSFIADGDTREGKTANFWTEVWVSADSPAQHWVEADLGASRRVAQADIYWGHWGSARFKVQYWNGSAFADTSTSAGTWLNGLSGHAVSRVQFEPVTTTRVRVLQDSNGGIPPPEEISNPRPGLMSVAELELRSAHTPAGGLLVASADSSYLSYSSDPLIDGVRTATCAPSACDGPGQLWVSEETPVEHFAEIQLFPIRWVGALRIDWGAWGSNSFTVRSWNGTGWVDHSTGSAASNALVEVAIGAYTDRVRIVQPAGQGAGRPADGYVRPNLMSIGEIALSGYRRSGRYESAPIRLSDLARTVVLTASESGIGGGQTASYQISTDDGANWTSVTSGMPASLPPGDRVRWSVDLTSAGLATPEVESVQLAFTGQARSIAPALWRGGRAGAISVGVDDSEATMLTPTYPSLDLGNFHGTSFVGRPPPPPPAPPVGLTLPGWWSFSYGHEAAIHTLTHGCANSPPDGAQANNLFLEFWNQTGALDALLPERGLLQSLAWPCGNYDLAKGSVSRLFFLSARGFRDGDPTITTRCPDCGWSCALPEGEAMELLEEPTPRNFMNLKSVAVDDFRLPELTDSKDVVQWAEQQGDWANFVYHYLVAVPYQNEVERMVERDVWVAPQGEITRYVKLRDSFEYETVNDGGGSIDFRVWTSLTPLDVPLFNLAHSSFPLGEVVERVFAGGVTTRVYWYPTRGEEEERALVWGNGVPLAARAIEGTKYVLFDTPLAPYPTPVHVDWTWMGDADGDGRPNEDDNCKYRPNFDQADSAGVALYTANLVGDRCECGDVSDDGAVDGGDLTLLRTELTAPGTLGTEGLAKCSVSDAAGPTCDIVDLVVLRRRLAQPRPLLPGTFPVCVAARP